MRTVKANSLILITLFVIILGIGLVGCGQGTPQPTPTATPTAPIVIGLLIPNDAAFFTTLAEGAEEAAGRLNATVTIQSAADDLATQQKQLQALIDEKVSALIIVPVDTAAIVPALEAAQAAGIPIFTVDRSATSDAVIAHIASDNAAGGRMAAEYLAETIGKKGNVVELTGIAGTSAAQDRGKGFNEGIAVFPDIHVVAQATGNFNTAEGEAAFAAILAEHDDIVGVFAHNDDMILGAIAAAAAAGRSEGIVFVGFDAIDAAVMALETGELDATIAQQPAEMGRLGVETAVKYLQGTPPTAFIPVELALITQ